MHLTFCHHFYDGEKLYKCRTEWVETGLYCFGPLQDPNDKNNYCEADIPAPSSFECTFTESTTQTTQNKNEITAIKRETTTDDYEDFEQYIVLPNILGVKFEGDSNTIVSTYTNCKV